MISRFKASGSSFPSPVAAAEIERHDQDDYEGSERPTVVNGGKQGNPVGGLHRGLHSREAVRCQHIRKRRNAPPIIPECRAGSERQKRDRLFVASASRSNC